MTTFVLIGAIAVVLVLAEIVNVWAFEAPPPGAGLNTITDAVPAVASGHVAKSAITTASGPTTQDVQRTEVVRLPVEAILPALWFGFMSLSSCR